MILVNKPFLPPIEDYNTLLARVWETHWVTNMGPLSTELETNLEFFLDTKKLLFVTNGTVAIQMAIKALDLKGEIITTPFSFVATTSSIVWEACIPVFVDIEKDTFNIDASKIEQAITKNTKAILATHVYGNPCNVFKIDEIAKKYNLKVIYDGAHAFGVKIQGKSIFDFGDITTCSLHATKLYHSGEGGLVVAQTKEVFEKLKMIRNFGFETPYSFKGLGINAKNSELHAGLGLVNLKYFDKIFNKRKLLAEEFDKRLDFKKIKKVRWFEEATQNYAYYPIVFESEELLLKCVEYLNSNEVFTRRYFYPSLADSLPYLDKKEMEITDDIAKRVLCLPFYYDLSLSQVSTICDLINQKLC